MSGTDEPAFPRDHRYLGHNGMTLRDYFAGQALAGILSNSNAVARLSWLDDLEDKAALGAYLYADAMLAERAKGGDQ